MRDERGGWHGSAVCRQLCKLPPDIGVVAATRLPSYATCLVINIAAWILSGGDLSYVGVMGLLDSLNFTILSSVQHKVHTITKI